MPKAKPAATSEAMKVEMWPIDRPIEYSRNPRQISEAAIAKTAASIKEFGFRVPIIVDAHDVIAAGHTRLKAAKHLGLTAVPVHVADKLTPAQVKAFRLMENKSHEQASWDDELLGLELIEIRDLDEIDLALTGFSEDELLTLLAGEESAGVDGNGTGSEGAEAARKSLAERFGVPPFSVLDARQGYWQDRKRAWLSLGIKSELGRGDAPIGGAPMPLDRAKSKSGSYVPE